MSIALPIFGVVGFFVFVWVPLFSRKPPLCVLCVFFFGSGGRARGFGGRERREKGLGEANFFVFEGECSGVVLRMEIAAEFEV